VPVASRRQRISHSLKLHLHQDVSVSVYAVGSTQTPEDDEVEVDIELQPTTEVQYVHVRGDTEAEGPMHFPGSLPLRVPRDEWTLQPMHSLSPWSDYYCRVSSENCGHDVKTRVSQHSMLKNDWSNLFTSGFNRQCFFMTPSPKTAANKK
jgi:hypothetical protein